MKRHPALQDLSRDHHFVLVYCQRLRRAIGRQAPNAELRALVEEFLAFYRSDMAAHFREEDDFVIPEAEATGRPDLVDAARTVHADHDWLRRNIEALDGTQDRDAVAALEQRITAHVHLEEERLFEGVQQALTEEELQAMWRRSFEFRRRNRAPAACTVRPKTPT